MYSCDKRSVSSSLPGVVSWLGCCAGGSLSVGCCSAGFEALLLEDDAFLSLVLDLLLVDELDFLLLDDAVAFPLLVEKNYFVLGKDVSGIDFYPYGGKVIFKNAVALR